MLAPFGKMELMSDHTLGPTTDQASSRPAAEATCIMMRTESRNQPYGRKMGLRSALRSSAYQKLFALHDGSFKSQSKSTHDANYRAQLRVKWAEILGEPTTGSVGLAVFVFGNINAARLNKLDAIPNALFAIFDNVLTMPFALCMSM
ncbi:hypothetical protein BGX23_000880 [Mortierella sp. AD031]|nr:hypothetical protein BGX23_000880 [Mortierella sp. AD031]